MPCLALLLAGCGLLAPAASPEQMASALEEQVTRVAIADREHIYGTYPLCEVDKCRLRLAATRDGGRSWSHHDLPQGPTGMRKPGVNDHTFTLTVIGPVTLRLSHWQSRKAWVTTDGGASWRPDPAAAKPVPVLPDGWSILAGGVGSHSGSTYVDIGDPATGQTGTLEVPRGAAAGHFPRDTSRRGIWLTTTASGDSVTVSASHDRGRTWISRSHGFDDQVGGGPALSLAVSADGKTAYLVLSRFRSFTSNPETMVVRSEDGGSSWTRVTPAGLPAAVRVESAQLLPDGTLLGLCGLKDSERVLYASKDGGRTFQQVAASGYPAGGNDLWPLPGGGWVSTLAADYVQVLPPVHLSDDGLTWREVQVPRA